MEGPALRSSSTAVMPGFPAHVSVTGTCAPASGSKSCVHPGRGRIREAGRGYKILNAQPGTSGGLAGQVQDFCPRRAAGSAGRRPGTCATPWLRGIVAGSVSLARNLLLSVRHSILPLRETGFSFGGGKPVSSFMATVLPRMRQWPAVVGDCRERAVRPRRDRRPRFVVPEAGRGGRVSPQAIRGGGWGAK